MQIELDDLEKALKNNRSVDVDLDVWTAFFLLKAEASPPDGYVSWKYAAIEERITRVKIERELKQYKEKYGEI